LYALDLNGNGNAEHAVQTYWELFEVDLEPESLNFARQLVCGTDAHMSEIDDAIQSASRNWRLDRMSRVDRNILRLATYELTRAEDIPIKVAINEAVELAKRYGADESAAFVNGILDRVAQEVRKA